jgi:hypothetical protein
MFISGPKAAAAMSDKHNIVMYVSGKSLPTLSKQSHITTGSLSVTSSNRGCVSPPDIETFHKKNVKKPDSLEVICISEAEFLDLRSDSDDNIQVHGAGKRYSQKRKVTVLNSDSDD